MKSEELSISISKFKLLTCIALIVAQSALFSSILTFSMENSNSQTTVQSGTAAKSDFKAELREKLKVMGYSEDVVKKLNKADLADYLITKLNIMNEFKENQAYSGSLLEINRMISEYKDELNDIEQELTETKNKYADMKKKVLDYLEVADKTEDQLLKSHYLIENLIILINNKSKNDFDQYIEEIDKMITYNVEQLKKIEAQKYEYSEKKSFYKNGYKILPSCNFIPDRSSYKYTYPLALKNDTVFVTLRSAADFINGRVLWNPAVKEAYIVKGKSVLTFKSASETVINNGKEEKMEFDAVIIDDITYVPLDYLTKTLKFSKLWIQEYETLILY